MFGMHYSNNSYVVALEGPVSDNRECKILFAEPLRKIKYKTTELSIIPADSLVVYQVLSRSSYGITLWDIYVFFCDRNSKLKQRVPNIYPPVDVLLYAKGKAKAQRFLKFFKHYFYFVQKFHNFLFLPQK